MPHTNDFEQQLAKQTCIICFKKRSIKKCPGHALGNEGGDEAGNDGAALRAVNQNDAAYDKKSGLKTPQLRLDTAKLKDWLHLTYDKESNIFSIKLDDPRFTAEQKNEFVQKLLLAWQEFRKEHNLNHPDFDPRIAQDKLGNVTITLLLPNKLFRNFVQFLVDKELLSEQKAKYLFAQHQNTPDNPKQDSYWDTMPISLQRMRTPFLAPKLKI